MQVDYLVKGAGAVAMAFVDAMLGESDATFAIVDKRPLPGGHWNDVYPYVRLHQPAAYYGVASRQLGKGGKDESGPNKGLYELSSGPEVAAYFHAVMRETFLPSGRVHYFPEHEYLGNGAFVSLRTGERRRVRIARKLIDATRLETVIPLTHQRKFKVAEGVACIPPNHLPLHAADFGRFTVLGSGKTGIDAVVWLLMQGVDPADVTWVAPRDPWLVNRARIQPGLEFFDASFGGLAAQYEIFAGAGSVRELCEGMEAEGMWFRVDPNVWPSMIHGATVSAGELDYMRRIETVVRKGRVKGIETSRLVLDEGEHEAAPDTLYVDCTARALAGNVGSRLPVFAPGIVSVQMMRLLQPTFNAAMAGFIEARIGDETEKRRLARVCPMPDTVEDWIEGQTISMANQLNWSADKAIGAWLKTCRLNAFASTQAQVRPDDVEKRAVLERMKRYAGPAAHNLARLVALKAAA